MSPSDLAKTAAAESVAAHNNIVTAFDAGDRLDRTLVRGRRQVLRIADVVGLSMRELRRGAVDFPKINNVERMLRARQERHPVGAAAKRAMDIVGSAFALFLLLPLLTLTALGVWLSTPGPAFYSQMRRGLNGRLFRVYKFRTFYHDRCDESGVVQTVPGDLRITPIGRFIRRTNIDELPQLWNVFKGDMSLVGPRPHVPGMKAGGLAYEDLVLVYPLRAMVKPGITGLAQVRGYRGPTKDRRSARMRIVCDLTYIAKASPLLDLKIMVLTFVRELRGGTGS